MAFKIPISDTNNFDVSKIVVDRVCRCNADIMFEGMEIIDPQNASGDDEKIVFRGIVSTDGVVECLIEIMRRPAVYDLNPNVCAYITYLLLQQMGIIRYRRLWGHYVDWGERRKIWVGVRKETSAVPPFWRDQRGVKAWLDPKVKVKKVGRRAPAHYDAYIAFVCSVVLALTTEDGHLRPELIIGERQRRVV